jgi:hypothetical protein
MPLIKIVVSVFMVITLSLIAEFVSPRVAGILSGYPLGAAISLFFIGFEISPAFASQSSLYTMIGLVGIQGFTYFYYLASCRVNPRRKWSNIVISSLAGLGGYMVIISILHVLKATILMSLVIPAASFVLFRFLFRNIRNVKIESRMRLDVILLFGRALFAGIVIILITAAAKVVGPRWAGLFSAFPITLFPVMVIVQFTYRVEHVHTLIKGVPEGLVSLFIYALVVHLTYPSIGIYFGTLIAYACATIYLIITHVDLRLGRLVHPAKNSKDGKNP